MKGGVMVIKILTDRPEKYAFVGLLSGDRVESCSSTMDLADEEADILIADPDLMEKDSTAAAYIRRRNSSGRISIISSPERKKSLFRELKAAGLVNPEEKSNGKDHTAEKDPELYQGEDPAGMVRRPSFRRRIGVIGLSEMASAGFVTMLLAEELASQSVEDGSLVTVFSPENDYFYQALKLGRSFEGREFRDIEEVMEERSEYGSERYEDRLINLSDGISWATGGSQKKGKSSTDGWLSMIDWIEGNHVICCCSPDQFRRELRHADQYLDVLLVIADPFPSSLEKESVCLEMVRSSGLPVVYVVSHMNDFVKKEMIQACLGTDEIIYLPSVDPAAVCEAEYSGLNPYRIDRIRRLTMPSVCGMIEKLDQITGRSL